MAGTAVVGAGNYIVEVDIGEPALADITTGINFLTVKRGRQDIGDQFSAGTMSFTILDVAGLFNPFDDQSIYYNSTEGQYGLAPLRRVQFARFSSLNVKEFLFKGVIVNYEYNFALGGLDTVTVYCADDFYLLSQTTLKEFNVTQELSSARLSAVLDLPEVDYPATRDIATGTQTLGGTAAFTVPEGTNVLAYCTQINDAEQGRLFMARDGDLTFDSRIGSTLSAAVADFHDDGTNTPYSSVNVTFEADQVVNRAAVAILGSATQQVADDAASQAKYFIQSTSITGSLLHDDPSALALASYLLEPEPEARYTSLGVNLNMLTTAQRDTVAIVDIGQTITIEKTFPSGIGTTEFAQELSVEGIEHTLSVSTGHSITFFTAPTTIIYELILDDLVYGRIDENNVLG